MEYYYDKTTGRKFYVDQNGVSRWGEPPSAKQIKLQEVARKIAQVKSAETEHKLKREELELKRRQETKKAFSNQDVMIAKGETTQIKTGDFEVTVIVKNHKLKQAILNAGYKTMKEFALKCKLSSQTSLSVYLALRMNPYDKKGELRKNIMMIMKTLKCKNVKDLFPANFLHKALRRNTITFVMTEDQMMQCLAAPQRTPEVKMLIDEAGNHLNKAISQLPLNQQKVIRLRYGFDDTPEMSLREVAKEIGVSQERVRQIELDAMLKLSHINRNRTLRSALDTIKTVEC